jgi:hypothetical protein
MSCEPRVKSPALRGMVPRAEWCCSLPGRARSDQVSGRRHEGLHPPLGFGQKFGVHLGVFALDDEVEREEGYSDENCRRRSCSDEPERSSMKRSMAIRRSFDREILRETAAALAASATGREAGPKSELFLSSPNPSKRARRRLRDACFRPSPMLGKQRHPGRAAYYIVIPTKSRIFRGFGQVHLAVLQSASLRITCKPTPFRHSSKRTAVYGLHLFPLIP